MLRTILAVMACFLLLGSTRATSSLQERTFDLTYTAQVNDIPAGSKDVQIWLPYPQSDDYQKILKAKVTAPYLVQIMTAAEYGNQMAHIDVKNPGTGAITVTMEFTVKRDEHLNNTFTDISSTAKKERPNLERWLQPDHLVPLDQRIRELS